MGFSTVNSVVEGKLLRGDSTKSRQMQDQEVAAAAKGGDNMGEPVAPHTHKLAKHPHNTEKEKKEKKEMKEQKEKKPRNGPTTGDVDDTASNITGVDDDDVASNNTAAVDYDELDDSDADEEEGED